MLRFAAILMLSIWAAGTASAQAWPTERQLTIVVPYAPGNITDIAARTVAQKLTEKHGRPVLVENRTGASSQIATTFVLNAPPDGYTLLMTGPQFSTNQSLFKQLPYDSEKDMEPVALVVTNPLVLVTAKSKPYRSARDLINFAKQKPGNLTMGSGGNGVLSHMAIALLAAETNTEIVHVPYKGGAPASVDTIAGHIDGMWDNLPSAVPHIKSDRLTPLAVSSKTRNPALPNVPALAEVGYPAFEALNWFGLFASSKVDPALIARIHAEVSQILAMPEVKERFAKDGVLVGSMTQPEFAAFVKAETRKWGEIIRKNNITAD